MAILFEGSVKDVVRQWLSVSQTSVGLDSQHLAFILMVPEIYACLP